MNLSFKTYPNWEVPDDVPFTNTVRNKFVRGAVAFWKTSVIAPFCRSHLTVETTAMQLHPSVAGAKGWPSLPRARCTWSQ